MFNLDNDNDIIFCSLFLFFLLWGLYRLCMIMNKPKKIENYVNVEGFKDEGPKVVEQVDNSIPVEKINFPKMKERKFTSSLVSEGEIINQINLNNLQDYNLLGSPDSKPSIQRLDSQLKQALPDAFSSVYSPVDFKSLLDFKDERRVSFDLPPIDMSRDETLLPDTNLHTETMKKPSKKPNKQINIIMIYAPWCGWSKKALPDFDKLIKDYNGKIINGTKVNVIKYDSEVDKDMVKKYEVEGYPTHILEIVTTSTTKEIINERDYNGLVSVIKKHV
jgi:thiol-disulfide isomerase/thioredoxin